MCPTDRNPPEDETPDEGEPPRHRGPSPVVQGARSKIGMVAGFLGILLVVGFLLVSGPHKPGPGSKSTPAIASSTGLLPAAPTQQGLPPVPPDQSETTFEVPNNQQHFGAPPAAAQGAEAAKQKAEARLHSPMLVYDSSGHEDAAPASTPAAPDPLNALMAAQLQNAGAAGASDQHRDRSSPAESYAELTEAFAKAAADLQVPEAFARRVTLGNRIAQGKMVPAILETAINSDLPGKLRAIVSQDVWSEDGSHRLIRRGSRLVGEYRSGLVRGQTRVFVIWSRLLEPDGTDIAISSPGSDDLGEAGLTGSIDRHFVERFGAAFLLSLIGSATTASQGGNTFVVNTSQGFGQVAQESLQDSINIPPTIFIDQGAPLQVFVARDLVFGASLLAAGTP